MRFETYPAITNVNAYIRARMRSRRAERVRISADNPGVPSRVLVAVASRGRRSLSRETWVVMLSRLKERVLQPSCRAPFPYVEWSPAADYCPPLCVSRLAVILPTAPALQP